MRPASLLPALALLVACASATPPPVDPSHPDAAPDPRAPIDIRQMAENVASTRHLALREPVHAEALDDATFHERLFARRASTGQANGAGTEVFWAAFGFTPRSVAVAPVARQVLEEDVAGFYDPFAKMLYVRGASGDAARIVPHKAEDRDVLAHEIEHALQDQNFTLPTTPAQDDDAELARRALYEGDAMLTMFAVRARAAPATDHWVSRVTKVLRGNPDEIMRRAGARSGALAGAPPLLQRRLLFPYTDGLVLSADLYRAGGLELVDKALAHPPVSTSQVLHPEKYVAGDQPVRVPTPALPEGAKVLTRGTMGELQTGVLLAESMPPADARQAACGWGGDAYAIVLLGGKAGILWSSIWDDEAAAERFEQALSRRVDWLRTASLDDRLGRDAHVLRDGRRVAYVQGIGDGASDAAAHGLLSLPAESRPAAPPFGRVTIPPLLIPEEVYGHHGAFGDGVWRSAQLGLAVPVPRSFSGLDAGPFEVLLQHRRSRALGGVGVLMAARTASLERAYLIGALTNIRDSASFSSQTLAYQGDSRFDLAGRTAHAYRWDASKGGRIQFSFLDACGGKATMVVLLAWGGDDGAAALHDWWQGLTLPAEDSPACAYLKQVTD